MGPEGKAIGGAGDQESRRTGWEGKSIGDQKGAVRETTPEVGEVACAVSGGEGSVDAGSADDGSVESSIYGPRGSAE